MNSFLQSNDCLGVDAVLITDELACRPARAPGYEAESRALASLAREMAQNPKGVLQKLGELVLELCHADSAGISILEPGGENGIFRWHAAVGAFAANLNGTMPREASPCGVVMARNSVLLFNEAERYFPALRGAEPRCYENILAPWTVNGEPVGTVWAIAHSPDKHFDAEDARLLQSMSSFASAAYQMTATLDEAKAGKHELEQRVAERTRLLSESNEQLKTEIAQRSQVETALLESQAQLAADLAGMRLLYELHAKLASETDLHSALDQIVAAACEFTGTERGCVQLVSDDGERLEIVVHRGYGPDSPFIEHFRYEGFAQGCDAARVERRRVIIEDTTTFPGLVGTPNGEAALAVGVRAAQSTPMISRTGEMVGVLSTHFRQPHRPSDDELRLIDLLAWTAADFVERHKAEKALHQNEQRQAFLLKLNDALRPLTDPIEIQSQVSRLLGEHLGANRALLGEFIGNELVIQRDYVSGVPSMAGRYPMAAFGAEHMRVFELGETFVVNDFSTDPRLSDTARATYARAEMVALISVGLVRNGKIVAAFGVHSKTPRQWSKAEVALVREVTEHARAALERARAEEALRQADRRKDEFLATLAHELRNPLAPISNAVQLLRHPDGRRTADRLVEMVGRQVQQIVKLVDDLLEISRITSGKVKLDKRSVALADVVQNAIEASRPLIDQACHKLTVSLPEEPVILDADMVRLTQVLTNLLNNAAKYTDAGGDIWLTARREGSEVVISVRDSGIGIPSKHLPYIFEMFTQLHRGGGRSQGGLGIGLTMVRDLVEMHGGMVEARSAGPGQGSEFVFRLPMLDATDAGADMGMAEMTKALLYGQCILVVDDNRDAADSLATLLEVDGAEVHTAYDGQSALAALATVHAHTVLLDLGMPVMDGYEVAKKIRQDHQFHDVRIVALTGWGQETDRDRTLSYGFDFHFTKPVNFAALKRWLTGASDQPEAVRKSGKIF